jgi:hypothetical protein
VQIALGCGEGEEKTNRVRTKWVGGGVGGEGGGGKRERGGGGGGGVKLSVPEIEILASMRGVLLLV